MAHGTGSLELNICYLLSGHPGHKRPEKLTVSPRVLVSQFLEFKLCYPSADFSVIFSEQM